MPFQTDYVLRLIEQLSGLVRGAMEKVGAKDTEDPREIAGEAIGLALDHWGDAATARLRRDQADAVRSLLE